MNLLKHCVALRAIKAIAKWKERSKDRETHIVSAGLFQEIHRKHEDSVHKFTFGGAINSFEVQLRKPRILIVRGGNKTYMRRKLV